MAGRRGAPVVDLLDIIGGGLAIAGALLAILGAVGVLRFPDVYTRIHAASITDTGGATLMIFGLCLIAGLEAVTLKLVIVWFLLMLTTPTAAHALGNAAFSGGHAPRIGSYRLVRDGETKPQKPGPSRP
jgi:multicomponent Na+:H+ antiporter subunit G